VVLIVGFFGTLPLANLLTLDLAFPLTIAHFFAAAIALTLLWQDRFRPRFVTWLPASLFLAFCVAYALSFVANVGTDLPQFSWAAGRNAPVIRSLTKVLWLLGNLAIALVIANAVRRSGSERRAIRALAVGAVVAAVYGLYQVIGGTHGFFIPVLPGTGPIVGRASPWVVLRAKGAFLEPNFFGAYLAAALPFVAVGWMHLEPHRTTGARTTALLLSLTIAGVIVTFAIGGWLPAAVAVVVLLALSGPIGARALLVRFGVSAIIATLAMVILIPNFPRAASALVYKGALSTGTVASAASGPPTALPQPSGATALPEPSKVPAAGTGDQPFSPADAEISADERSAFVQAALRMFASSPIVGVGPGNFGLRYPEFRSPGVPEPTQLSIAANIYVELLAETGLVGFLTFLGGFIGLAVLAARASRREHVGNRVELAAGIAAMAAIATAFLASPTFTLLYQWAIIGLVGALVARSHHVGATDDPVSDVAPVGLATR
jgi:O-Antigen ligase.